MIDSSTVRANLPSLPPFAGLCSFPEAQRAALGIEESVNWLKRHHYVFQRLHQILNARITAEPLFELKTAFSHQAYLCSEHVFALRQRVSEMREPPLGLEVIPHPGLEQACNEVLGAPTTEELLLGLYEVLLPSLLDSEQEYIQTANPLADAPSVRISRFALMELQDMQAFGIEAVGVIVSSERRAALRPWLDELEACIQAAGGVSGQKPISSVLPERRHSRTPFEYQRTPVRDQRFHDGYNAGVNPEAFLHDPRFAPRDKVLMLLYKRLREIDVPEMMASIIHETPGRPWKFYRDMSRQLWDEARHALMGQLGFQALGLDWTQIPINFTWSLNLNTQLTPQERHAVLFFIEQGLMPKTGKRYEYEVGRDSGLPLMRLIQDFDWADEVLHAQLGREWYVKNFGDLNAAMAYGDECWSKVLSHWRAYRDKGLTQHHNWWPDFYRHACQTWGVDPDPAALEFAETYESSRADLQPIAME